MQSVQPALGVVPFALQFSKVLGTAKLREELVVPRYRQNGFLSLKALKSMRCNLVCRAMKPVVYFVSGCSPLEGGGVEAVLS